MDIEGGIFDQATINLIIESGSLERARSIALEAVDRFEAEHPKAYTDFAKIRYRFKKKTRSPLDVAFLATNMMLSRHGDGVI